MLSFVKRARRVWSRVAQLRMQSGQYGALVGGVQEVLHSLPLGGSRRLSVSLHWSLSARRERQTLPAKVGCMGWGAGWWEHEGDEVKRPSHALEGSGPGCTHRRVARSAGEGFE